MTEEIYTIQMGGFNATAAASTIQNPKEYKALVAFTLGYLGDAESLSQPAKA